MVIFFFFLCFVPPGQHGRADLRPRDGLQQRHPAAILRPRHQRRLPVWKGEPPPEFFFFFLLKQSFSRKTQMFETPLVFPPLRVTAASGTLRSPTRRRLSTTSTPSPPRSPREGWDTCPNEAWTSTSVKLQGGFFFSLGFLFFAVTRDLFNPP